MKTIGLLYETYSDAERLGVPIERLDHWREECELDAIEKAIRSAGHSAIRIGPPDSLIDNWDRLRNTVDFIMTLSVGFVSRYRQALGPMACILAGLPHTGPDPYAKIIGQNKHILKSFFDKMHIPTPAWSYIHSSAMLDQVYPPFPLIVKPACEGTSIGIGERSLVTTQGELCDAVEYLLHDVRLPVLVEQFIEGREYKIGYIGNGTAVRRGMLEDVHRDGSPLGKDFLHYEAKQRRKFGKRKCDAAAPEYASIVAACDLAYDLFGPADYGVFDIRRDERGRFFIVDFNTDATLHPDKTLAACCRFNGIPFEEMIHSILESAFIRQDIAWN